MTEKPRRRRKRRSPRRPGPTIPQFARRVGTTPAIIRAAVRNGVLQAVDLNGVLILTAQAQAFWDRMWGDPSVAGGAAGAATEQP